jgi:hypothetical protein
MIDSVTRTYYICNSEFQSIAFLGSVFAFVPIAL